MKRVIHLPTVTIRRVAGERSGIFHFMQVIKREGETFYWADVAECEIIPASTTPWEIRVRILVLEIQNRRAKEKHDHEQSCTRSSSRP